MTAPAHVTIRAATATDAAAVAGIHNLGIDGRLATFETEHRTAALVAEAINGTSNRHAFLVAKHEAQVVGWAATFPYSPRPAYAGVAEYSVYVHPAAVGQGVGRSLLTELLARAEKAGLHKVTSRIFPENAASLALAKHLGFREVGIHRAHAQLDGVWRDVVTVEALLGAARGVRQTSPPGT